MAAAAAPTRAQLDEASRALLQGVELVAVSVKAFRHRLAAHLGLQPDGLDDRREEVGEILRAAVQELHPEGAPAAAAAGPVGPDWDAPEDSKVRQWVYLVTFAATLPGTAEAAAAGGGPALRTLDGVSREQIRDAILDAVANPVQSTRVRQPREEDARQEASVFEFCPTFGHPEPARPWIPFPAILT